MEILSVNRRKQKGGQIHEKYDKTHHKVHTRDTANFPMLIECDRILQDRKDTSPGGHKGASQVSS